MSTRPRSSLATPVDIVGVYNPVGPSHGVRGVPAIDPDNPPEADRWVLAVAKNSEAALAELEKVVPSERIVIPDLLRLFMLRSASAQRGAA